MKKILLLLSILLVSFSSLGAQTESVNRFIRKAKRCSNHNERVDFTVPGWLLRLGLNFVDEADLEGIDFDRFAHKISEVRILNIDGKVDMLPTDVQSYMADIKSEGYEDLLIVREKSEKVTVMIREKKAFIRNILLMVHDSNELTVLSIEGKFTMDDVNKMLENVDFGHKSLLNNNKPKKGQKERTLISSDGD